MSQSISIDKLPGGEISINSNFSEAITLSKSGQEVIVCINNISELTSLDNLITNYTGANTTSDIKTYYRVTISDNPSKQSQWIEINTNGQTDCFSDLSPFYDYNVELKFVRVGSNNTGEIKIDSFIWTGTYDINKIDTPEFNLTSSNSPIIYEPSDTYKVFNLTGYELISRNSSNMSVEYRISQNDKRTWTQWTPLTTENLITEKIDQIRFFNIQYKFLHNGSNAAVQVRDLNIYGEFINVTQNYQTSNLMGIRPNCKNGMVGQTGLNASTGTNNLSMTSNTISEPTIWSTIEKNSDNLFNPYKQAESIEMYNKLANDVSDMIGWTVEYYKTDPDGKGIDKTIHEYSLYNIIQKGDIKVIVPDNQFPSNVVSFNQYDMALLDSFEVHITKQGFKEIFGVQYRPSKEDFLYFCEMSRMYRVEHAQAIRDFANSSVYYKLILGKYNQRSNVKPENSTIQQDIQNVLKNSTLQDLFGTEIKNDKQEVAFKKQHDTLTNDRIRTEVIAPIDKILLENAELVLNKYAYNLSKIDPNADAVLYKDSDIYLQEGKNRSYYAWFRLIDHIDDNTYNFIDNYSDTLNKGYKINIENGKVVTYVNSNSYSHDITNFLIDDVWMCLLVNIDQRQREITHTLYKRDTNDERYAGRLNSTKLKLLSSNTQDYVPNSFELIPDDLSLKIKASSMYLTNIRIFDDIIDDSQVTKILNQQIIRDTDHLIMGDNANKILKLPRYPYK